MARTKLTERMSPVLIEPTKEVKTTMTSTAIVYSVIAISLGIAVLLAATVVWTPQRQPFTREDESRLLSDEPSAAVREKGRPTLYRKGDKYVRTGSRKYT
jgi:hypothetical protein